MRRIRIIEHISIDGVIQAPGGRGEDGDFQNGGWIVPFSDPAVGEVIVAAHSRPFDLLLGRRTYDLWSGHWPNLRGGPIADGFNAATKYVATHRPQGLAWGPVKALGPDVAADLRDLKSQEGPNLILWGSSSLTSTLLANELADEILLLVYPVLLGAGKQFFAAPGMARNLSLVSTKAAASGVLINTYRPGGPLKTGSFLTPPV